MNYRELSNQLNGRFTARRRNMSFSYDVAKPQDSSNHWCVTENNRNNARNVNFNDGNANNNNKYNGNVIRGVAAFGDYVPASFLSSVWEAYHDCIKGKMTSPQAVEYMPKASTDIPKLAYELWSGTYEIGTSTCFLVKYPKWREVFAANFRDRIVHHWICMRLEPLFEERFVYQNNHSFNCRKGFGTNKAVLHIQNAMERISDNYHKQAWIFKGDLVGFFMSIDKNLLWYLLERFITRWRKRNEREGWSRLDYDIFDRLNMREMPEMYWDILLRTTKKVVMHHPEKNCTLNSPISFWKNLQPNKSLFTSPTGEPIGNLTTQLFANFLMSYFVQRVLYLTRRKNFDMAQFVDDFIMVCDDKRFLIDLIPQVEDFLYTKLKLTLHKDKRYMQPVYHGVLFVGSYIKPKRNYLSNRTVARMCGRCHKFGKILESGMFNNFTLYHIEQVLNSYMGFCKGHRTYEMKKAYIEMLGSNFWKYFYVKGHYESIRLKESYRV